MEKFLGRCWGHVTFGSHGTCTTTKKKGRGKNGHAQNILPDRASSGDVSLTSLPVKNCTTIVRKKTREKPGMRRTYFGTGPLPEVTSLPVKRPPPGRIFHNFWLRMRIAYFRTWPVPVTWLTSLPVAPPHRSTTNDNWAVLIYYLPLLSREKKFPILLW